MSTMGAAVADSRADGWMIDGCRSDKRALSSPPFLCEILQHLELSRRIAETNTHENTLNVNALCSPVQEPPVFFRDLAVIYTNYFE